MWHLFLDESGDLGFDFVNKRPSKYFTITILATSSDDSFRQINKAVTKTLARKLNYRKKHGTKVQELKGTGTTIEVKKYFFGLISDCKFGIYSITLNKRKVYERLTKEKERVYNYVTRLVLDQIPFEKNGGVRVNLVIDKCKGKPEIREFNEYIKSQLSSKIDPNIPLDINHEPSQNICGLQAADLFCWGIFRKYERNDPEWLEIYQKKVLYDRMYL